MSRRRETAFSRFVSVTARVVAVLVLLSLVLVLISMNSMYGAFDDVNEEIERLVNVLDDLPTGSRASMIFAGDYDPGTRHGTLLGTLADENRQVASYSEIPPQLIACVLSTEDKHFFTHHGVDYMGMGRAVLKGARRGGDIRGTSTITQQLSRNVFLKHIRFERKYDRKMQEIIIAMAVEEEFSKEEILEAYLNHIYFGNQSYGVKAAARNYFNKSLDELTLAECAMLAGLPQRPSSYDPTVSEEHKQDGLARRDAVLKLLGQRLRENFFAELKRHDAEKFGKLELTRDDIKAATAEPLKLARQRDRMQMYAPYFTSYVRDSVLAEQYGEDVVRREGWTIVTTIDPLYQKWAEQTVKDIIDKNRKSKKISQGALILLEAKSGAVLANVGGYQWGALNDKGVPDELNRAFISGRQTGSSFKPFTYATAYEQGFEPSMAIFDGPNKEASQRLKKAWPHNSDGSYRGWMSMYRALQFSRNAASVDLLVNCTGIQPVIETARRMGVTADLPEVPALTLGVANIKPIEMAGAFSTFPNMGTYVKPITIRQIYDQNGILIADYTTQASIETRSNHGALTPTTAWMMVENMRLCVNAGTGGRARVSGVQIAGKTGTTDDFTDAWFVGYSPDLVCAVWVGNDDFRQRLNHVFGGDVPAQIFHDLMTKVYSKSTQGSGETKIVTYDPALRWKALSFTKPEAVEFSGFSGGSSGSGMANPTEGGPPAEGAATGEGGAEQGGEDHDHDFYDPWVPDDDDEVYF